MAQYTEPMRLRVMNALKEVLETPNGAPDFPANGKVDLAGKVFVGRAIFGDNDPETLVSILETPQPIDQIPSPDTSIHSTGDWDLLIQGWTPEDVMKPLNSAYILCADVVSKLSQQRERKGIDKRKNILGFGGKVDRLEIGSPVVRPPDENSPFGQFWLRITLRIVENLENPYTDRE